MTKSKDIFLVIRTGSLDKEDAMEEVKKVIDDHKYCWFGKYGQPLNKELPKIVKDGKKKIVVVLVQKDATTKDGYKLKQYKLLDMDMMWPKDNIYPKYYKRVMSRMGSWLKLANYPGKNVEISDLLVMSSMNPLANSLRYSNRGHFLCISRSGD